MKRTRNSTASNANPSSNEAETEEVSHIQSNYSGPSFSDLPNNILVTILLNLSVKWIFVCKSVCKSWYDLISDPDFAKLYFSQAQVCPLLQTSGFTFLSRMVYLVQPEEDDFERKLKLDVRYDFEGMLQTSCVGRSIKIKLDCGLKLPLRSNGKKLIDMRNREYHIVNSCNGLLCLSDPSDHDEPVIVCNPVTGEFINLPKVRTGNNRNMPIESGFGFSPVTNQYKVIRMFTRRNEIGYKLKVAEVHVLGTETWKDLQFFPESKWKLFPTYLNGFVYWFSPSEPSYDLISFDIEKECFESVSVGVPFGTHNLYSRVSMGVLGGKLCITEALDRIDFWEMKDHDGEKAWSKMHSIKMDDEGGWPGGSYQPIKYLNDGALLMFNSWQDAFIYLDPKKFGYKYLKVHGADPGLVALPHIPSFVSLKHVLSGHNVTVLNVNSRCEELKLHEEGEGVSIVEELMKLDNDDYDYYADGGITSSGDDSDGVNINYMIDYYSL